MSITTEDAGLCNQIIRNLSLSLLAKKFDLYVKYSKYNKINNQLGIKLFCGTKKYNKTIEINDNNYMNYYDNIIENDANFNFMNYYNGYFQTLEITNILHKHFKTNKVYTETVDGFPNIMKVYNMLSTHGLIICSALGATICQKAMSDAFYKNIVWDQPIALLQPYYNVYSLKEPLVYQDGKLGGLEGGTKIPLSLQFADKPMPSFLKNTTNFSVITSSKKIK